MKKKVFCTVLAMLLCMSLAACGGDQPSTAEQNNPPVEAETPEPPAEPEETTPASGGKMEQSGTLGNFDVEIKEAKLAEDYEGNLAIVITYSWTNNSEETTSVMATMMEKAFQDGVQLDTAIIGDEDVYDSEIGMKDIRPGTTIDAQCAFVMTSETAIVEFEISEFLGFSDDLVIMNFDPTAI